MTTLTLDQQIEAAQQKLKDMKTNLETAKKDMDRGWKTNCRLEVYGRAWNLHVTKAADAIEAMGAVLGWESNIKEASKRVTLTESQMKKLGIKLAGYSPSDWIQDLQKCVARDTMLVRQAEITRLELKLQSLESSEARRQRELANVLEDLNDLSD